MPRCHGDWFPVVPHRAMLSALLPSLRAPACSPAQVAMTAAPEAFSHPLLYAPVDRSRRAVAASPRASGPRLSLETDPAPAPTDRARGYGNEEDKALRLCRTSFGGYPAGAYYELEQAEGLEAAYALVRADHAALADWSDAEIGLALKELKTTPLEVLASPYSLGVRPFLTLTNPSPTVALTQTLTPILTRC